MTPQSGREYTHCHWVLAASGALCALVTGTRTKTSQQLVHRHLGVLHLASGCLREYALSDFYLAGMVKDSELCVCWSRDCSAVLVADMEGSFRRVFRFC